MTCRIEHLTRAQTNSASAIQHCPHAQEVATGPCSSENLISNSNPTEAQTATPTATPTPTPTPTQFDCNLYKTTCVDTSITPAYGDCASTVALNPNGMTCRIEHL